MDLNIYTHTQGETETTERHQKLYDKNDFVLLSVLYFRFQWDFPVFVESIFALALTLCKQSCTAVIPLKLAKNRFRLFSHNLLPGLHQLWWAKDLARGWLPCTLSCINFLPNVSEKDKQSFSCTVIPHDVQHLGSDTVHQLDSFSFPHYTAQQAVRKY